MKTCLLLIATFFTLCTSVSHANTKWSYVSLSSSNNILNYLQSHEAELYYDYRKLAFHKKKLIRKVAKEINEELEGMAGEDNTFNSLEARVIELYPYAFSVYDPVKALRSIRELEKKSSLDVNEKVLHDRLVEILRQFKDLPDHMTTMMMKEGSSYLSVAVNIYLHSSVENENKHSRELAQDEVASWLSCIKEGFAENENTVLEKLASDCFSIL